MNTTSRKTGYRILALVSGVAALLLAFAPGSPAGADAGGVTQCPEGTTAVAKYNRDGETTNYTAEYGGDIVTLSNTTMTGGDWSSTVPIDWVIVKGGNGDDGGTNVGGATSGSFSNANVPPVGQGNIPAVSHVLFCKTTTTDSSTDSTVGSSTTTTEATTTTTEATTTTAGVTATTAEEPTTSTSEETTTSIEEATMGAGVESAGVEALPHTGASTLPLVLGGLSALLTGASMLTASGRRSEDEDLES